MSQQEVNQNISSWVDEDNLDEQTLKQLLKDPEAAKSWESYHLMRAVINDEVASEWQPDFSDKVAAAIADEPAILAPVRRSGIRQAVTGWALAASVAAVALVSVQWLPTGDTGSTQIADTAASEQGSLLAEYHVTPEEQAQLERIEGLFAQFAQQSAHNNQGSQLPRVRMVSGEQARTYRMSPQQFRQLMAELERRNEEARIQARKENSKVLDQ